MYSRVRVYREKDVRARAAGGAALDEGGRGIRIRIVVDTMYEHERERAASEGLMGLGLAWAAMCRERVRERSKGRVGARMWGHHHFHRGCWKTHLSTILLTRKGHEQGQHGGQNGPKVGFALAKETGSRGGKESIGVAARPEGLQRVMSLLGYNFGALLLRFRTWLCMVWLRQASFFPFRAVLLFRRCAAPVSRFAPAAHPGHPRPILQATHSNTG